MSTIANYDASLFSDFIYGELLNKYRHELADGHTLRKIKYDTVIWLKNHEIRLTCGCRITNVNVVMRFARKVRREGHLSIDPVQPTGCNH